jgi:hypothetical protein
LKPKIVRARAHHGSSSLDLTIPAELVKELKVAPGDVFKVAGERRHDGIIAISYSRVNI